MITGGCFLRHDAMKHFDYDTVGEIVNANLAHDRGFFVGNHPRDLSRESCTCAPCSIRPPENLDIWTSGHRTDCIRDAQCQMTAMTNS